ncbi:T9SS type A sorting domain-containing protein, partial [candidate division KSB1 bacterium]|nr:T9SS type A sorting domain-containing protein [candidate division KSB1 bacterium]
DEINYRTVKMSFGLPWGGADGFVEVTDFTISDAPEDKISCAYIFTGYPDRQPWDSSMVAYLQKTYDVTLVTDNSIMDGDFTIDNLKEYDFAFVSESVSDWKLGGVGDDFMKKAPIPYFHAELWLAAPAYMGIVSAEGLYGTIMDSLGNGGKVFIVDEENHPLSAGLAPGSEIEVVTDTDEEDERGMLTYCVPEVDHIPIAVWAGDPSLTVVLGLEVGTPLYDALGLTIDPTLVNENRVAVVGIYARAYDYITEDGYKLIDAGINWILDTGTAVEDEDQNKSETPARFELAQNYPNPFNPSTEIVFSLTKTGHATLSIYNVLGQLIETLVDQELAVGTHRFTFDAQNIPSGIYFYRLQSEGLSQIKKMMYMK